MIDKEFNEDIRDVERILGYEFKDRSLLLNALTRRSFWHENRETCEENNERMEFLGDAVLGLVIADTLYRLFPDDKEGELQKKRASLVNRSTLANLTRELDLARFIRMGKGDDLSGCRQRDSILADTFEALLAAVYLDGGVRPCGDVIERLFKLLFNECSDRDRSHDSRSMLQEKFQAEFGVTPSYKVLEEWGEEHRKTFAVAVFLGKEMVGQGIGSSKREAAQNAAREALQKLDGMHVS